jgi:transposase InsO family protein
VKFPSVSTLAELLKREGLVKPHRRRRTDATLYPHLSAPAAPNDLWCIDFKGQFRLGTGRYCYPLTLTDAASRFILVCEGFDRICGHQVRKAMELAFGTHGLPAAIRFDGGAPFASTGLRRLSTLSAWWLQLGIRLEQTEPGCPQQNGRHERMHRTLKAETTRPPAANFLQQQERFDRFIEHFNTERPHEALDMRRPADVFVRSMRTYSGEPPPPDYPFHDLVTNVTAQGHFRIPGQGRRCPNVFLSGALARQRVGLRELGDDRWLVSFLDIDLGILDERKQFIPGGTPVGEPPGGEHLSTAS